MAPDRSADLDAALHPGPLDAATVGRLDREHVWHPYSSPIDAPELPVVVGADGVRLTLADGREVVDGVLGVLLPGVAARKQ